MQWVLNTEGPKALERFRIRVNGTLVKPTKKQLQKMQIQWEKKKKEDVDRELDDFLNEGDPLVAAFKSAHNQTEFENAVRESRRFEDQFISPKERARKKRFEKAEAARCRKKGRVYKPSDAPRYEDFLKEFVDKQRVEEMKNYINDESVSKAVRNIRLQRGPAGMAKGSLNKYDD
mmetsp:Transcript_20403/g.36294  ORF Transcript_20403/g.36294 Transcript_20403/m.36294 type:complete len:175 (+) Transcript_20403:55-579(+)